MNRIKRFIIRRRIRKAQRAMEQRKAANRQYIRERLGHGSIL